MANQAAAYQTSRRTASVVHSRPLLAEARAVSINPSRADERGTAGTMAEAERWLAENCPAMDAWNAYVGQHGLPLADFRQA